MSKPPQARATVEQIVQRLVQQGRAADIESELKKYDPAQLTGEDRESWHVYWGIEAFRRGDRREAFARFTQAHAACPESDQIAFSLGQEYEARGEPAKMLELFSRCAFPRISARHLLAASRYCYLWNLLDDGIRFLHPIRNAYFQLRVADDTFVYMRGLPFVSQTWDYFLCFSHLKRDWTPVQQFTTSARNNLTDFDIDSVEVMLRCYQQGSFAEKIEGLERTLHDAEPAYSQGYLRTQLACLRAVCTADPIDAVKILEAVTLEQGDFPWLADILLIQRARLAGLANRPAEEENALAQFFRKQPLLFEPEHAVNFGLLDYQEKLKPRYQQVRKASVQPV